MNSDDTSAILRAAKQLLINPPRGPAPKIDPNRRIGVANHTNKVLHSVSVNPDQAAEFNEDARKFGFTDIHFDKDGRCHSASRKAEQEYVYFRTGYVNRDGGYYETIRDDRRRDLDRLRDQHG